MKTDLTAVPVTVKNLIISLHNKKIYFTSHCPPCSRGDQCKSRACCITDELSDFNEKSCPYGLLFPCHILSAILQKIILPFPIARKQMACGGNLFDM